MNDLEIRASELEKALESSQQTCLEAEAQHRQASDELDMLREELERLNKQLADSRASSASERATKQVHESTDLLGSDFFACVAFVHTVRTFLHYCSWSDD